jgi:hypothetical protein
MPRLLTPDDTVQYHMDVPITQNLFDTMYTTPRTGATLWVVIGWTLEAMTWINEPNPVFQRPAPNINNHGKLSTAGGMSNDQICRWYLTLIILLANVAPGNMTSEMFTSFQVGPAGDLALNFRNAYRQGQTKFLRKKIRRIMHDFSWAAHGILLRRRFVNSVTIRDRRHVGASRKLHRRLGCAIGDISAANSSLRFWTRHEASFVKSTGNEVKIGGLGTLHRKERGERAKGGIAVFLGK